MNNCLIGFSKENITPVNSVIMGGYGHRKGKSIGVHDNIYAHSIYFSFNDIEFVMVSLDILGLFNRYVNYFRGLIEKKIGIPKENILIHCVHNHSGPDTIGLTNIKGFLKKTIKLEIFRPIGNGIIKSILEAKKLANPSKIGANKIDIEKRLIINRREPLKDSRFQVGVIRIDDLNGNMRGIIINYACHGTVLSSENNEITADYIGYINKWIEEVSDNKVFSIYFNGPCGDINPNLFDFNIKLEDIDKSILYDGPRNAKGSFKRAQEIGGSIAKNAWKLAQNIETKEVKKVNINYKVLYIPAKNILLNISLKNQLMNLIFIFKLKLFMILRKISNLSNYNFITKNGVKLKTEIQVLQINDIIFSTLPGEFFLNLGEKILDKSPSNNTFIIELANDCAGYFFSIPDYVEGGYESILSFCPVGGTYITNQLINLIKKTNSK